MSVPPRIGFIGPGNMAFAIAKGLHSARAKRDLGASGPSDSSLTRFRELGAETMTDNRALVEWADVIVLAVKPQVLPEVLSEFGEVDDRVLWISVAVGVPISTLQKGLGSQARIVRTMPNTPSLIGKGVCALSAGSECQKGDLALASELFRAVGATYEVSEDKLDVVAGLSGGGPAYSFVFLDALADAAVREGLPRKMAQDMAAQTLEGAAALFLSGSSHPGALKDQVTSPGGTTIEGIAALDQGNFRAATMAAVRAATRRARALSSGSSS